MSRNAHESNRAGFCKRHRAKKDNEATSGCVKEEKKVYKAGRALDEFFFCFYHAVPKKRRWKKKRRNEKKIHNADCMLRSQVGSRPLNGAGSTAPSGR